MILRRHASLTALVLAAALLLVNASCGGGVDRPADKPFVEAPETRPSADGAAAADGNRSLVATTLALPSPRRGHLTLGIGATIVVLGGRNVSAVATVDRLDVESATWDRLADLPTPREGLAGAVIDRKIFAVSGRTAAGLTAVLECLDLATASWSRGADVPTARVHAKAVVHDDRLWLLGGFNEDLGRDVDSVDIYDPVTDTWLAGPPLPKPTHGHAATTASGTIHVLCGHAEGRAHWILQGDRWVDARRPPVDKTFAEAFGFHGKLHLLGGTPGIQEHWIFDLATETWTAAPNVPVPLEGVAMAMAHGKLVATGGIDKQTAGEAAARTVGIYDLVTGRWLSTE